MLCVHSPKLYSLTILKIIIILNHTPKYRIRYSTIQPYSTIHLQALLKHDCINSVLLFLSLIHTSDNDYCSIETKVQVFIDQTTQSTAWEVHHYYLQHVANASRFLSRPIVATTLASSEATAPGLQAAVAGCIVLSVALILVLACNVILCGRQKRIAGEMVFIVSFFAKHPAVETVRNRFSFYLLTIVPYLFCKWF